MKKNLKILFLFVSLFILNHSARASSTSVVINEIAWMGTEASASDEWMELYNNSAEEVDLTGWTLASSDGNIKITLAGKVSANGYFLLERTDDNAVSDIAADQIYTGSLSNSGTKLELDDASGNVIDFVDCASGWFAGDNETKASMERKDSAQAGDKDNWITNDGITINGKDAKGNNLKATPKNKNSAGALNENQDASSTATGTSENMATTTTADTSGSASSDVSTGSDSYDYSNDIKIWELFPNPKGNDRDGEFIELFNKGKREVDLTGWALENERGQRYELDNKTIKSEKYLVITRKESNMALNNHEDEIKLFQPLHKKASQVVSYKDADEDVSYAFDTKKNVWTWTKKPTPGAENIINHPPEISIDTPAEITAKEDVIFDASDTIDPDNDPVTYVWDFGDGVKSDLETPDHIYLKPGIYKLKLTASDGKDEGGTEIDIKVASAPEPELIDEKIETGDIVLNEIFPNPAGSDENKEWIEILNRGDSEINLGNWKIENGEKRKYNYVFENLILKPGEFYVLNREASGLTLKNSGDNVNLYNPLGGLNDHVGYAAAPEAESYARNKDGTWTWTKILTPGKENVIQEAVIKTKTRTVSTKKKKTSENLQIVEGIVEVKPGIFGSQYFYVAGESGGTQVYNYKKDFPNLAVGDLVSVAGEETTYNKEPRIKTANAAAIKVLAHNQKIEPRVLSCDELNEDYLGKMVTVAGEITGKSGSEVYVDDGKNEALVYIKKGTGIKTQIFENGKNVSVTGIVANAQNGVQVLPRSMDDIKFAAGNGEVLGTAIGGNEWALAQRDKQNEFMKYMLILSGGVILILGGWMVKLGSRK